MGLFGNLFKKIASGQAGAESKKDVDLQNQNSGGGGRSFGQDDDEKDCGFEVAIVERRIRKVLAEEYADCELKSRVVASRLGIGEIKWTYSYGIFRDNLPVAMINILTDSNDYRKKIVLQSKQACEDRGMGYVHFILHLPNRLSYIREQIRKIV